MDYRNNVEDFAAVFMQELMPLGIPKFHKEIYADLSDRRKKRLAIIAPRGFAKSVTTSIMYATWEILNGKSKEVILCSATGTLAEKWLDTIKTELEFNTWIKAAYGDVKGETWTKSHLIVKRRDGRRVEVWAKGAGYQVRGFRPQTLIVDDIENDEETDSPEQREKIKRWFYRALLGSLTPVARAIVIGTLLHPTSLLSSLLNNPSWECRFYSAILPNGESLWEEQWPVKTLRAMWEESKREDPGGFEAEYMNQPRASANPIFKSEWIKPYDPKSLTFKEEIAKGCYTLITVDPAISVKDKADFTAIVTTSSFIRKDSPALPDGSQMPDIYIRPEGTFRGHWQLHETVQKLVKLYEDMNANAIAIECVAFQLAVADEFERYMREHGGHCNVIRLNRDTDKVRRAHAVSPLVARGTVHADFTDWNTLRLIDELVLFPTGNHDDFEDAFVDQVGIVTKRFKSDKKKQKGPHIVLPGGQRYHEHTGVPY